MLIFVGKRQKHLVVRLGHWQAVAAAMSVRILANTNKYRPTSQVRVYRVRIYYFN